MAEPVDEILHGAVKAGLDFNEEGGRLQVYGFGAALDEYRELVERHNGPDLVRRWRELYPAPLQVPEGFEFAYEPIGTDGEQGTQGDQHADAAMIERLMQVYGVEKPWTSAELNAAEITTTFLIDRVLVEGELGLIAGASKTCKTSIGIDLALSLGLGRRFLGQFWVPEAKRVLFLSAESGKGTIKETARRVARSKGFDLDEDENVSWGFWVPRAKNGEQLMLLDHQLAESGAEVCVIDPLYMSLDGEDQANLSMNGQQVQLLTQRCLGRGITPILIDHVKRSSANAQNHRPLELNDVSGAGKAEVVRQWVLVSRREQFNPGEQVHRLWMSVGGSAGHCGLWAVDIDETRDEATEGRSWIVHVGPASEVSQANSKRKSGGQAEKHDFGDNPFSAREPSVQLFPKYDNVGAGS